MCFVVSKPSSSIHQIPWPVSIKYISLQNYCNTTQDQAVDCWSGRRHGQLLMMVKDGEWTQRSAADFAF